MHKLYVSEQELREIYDSEYIYDTREDFDEWIERKIEEGDIELIEFDHYDISKLKHEGCD